MRVTVPRWYGRHKDIPADTEVVLDKDQSPRCKCPARYYTVVETGERIHVYPWFVKDE